MSYQVLARKWRPRSFREMVGQEHVLQALVNALDHDRLHHAYLFTGTRGVGKTTIARILAKCLNCEEGVSSEPCGKCSSCLEIAEGRSVDLLEVDAASRTKVEDTRELLENVQYAPTRARYKVYLIDEVHMLSNHSFNALLKTLEEPPPHVKFLLATTDPQKLPATILSRCLQFNLKNMPPEQIVSHLGNVLGQESVSFEEPALWLLGRSAAGSMRDALSLTDQAIAFGSGRIGEDDVRAMLGSVDLSFVYQLLERIAEGEPREVLAVVERMAEHAPDFEGSLDELISLVHRIAIAQAVPDAIDNSWGDAERVAAIAASITAEDAQLFYQMAINGKRDIALAPDPRSGFEMILLRMLAFRPQAVIDESIDASSLQAVEVAAAPESEPGPARDMASAAGEGGAPVKKPPEVPQPAAAQAPTPLAELGQRMVESAAPERQDVAPPVTPPEPGPGPGETALGDSEPTSSVAGVPDKIHDSKAVEAAQSIALAELDSANWALLLEQLGLVGIIYNTASHCELRQCKDGKLEFILDEPRAALFNEGHVDKIRLALENYFEAELSVSIAPGEIQVESPAMRCERLALERQQQAVAEIEGDPVLQGFIARFDGELDPASIAPLDQ